ncbi:hypothetical protein M0R72_13560 [Candidatus Pacearchaeota archaeon]|jgi:replicative DNA helicase|nr:hypothetical protein [Candidatus Pacearchaeota archaeon]
MKLSDHEAEWRTLEMLICDNDALDGLDLSTSDFDNTRNAAIFAVISNTISQGVKADAKTIASKLMDSGASEESVMVSTMDSWTSANIAYYAGKVRDLSRKRQVVRMMHEVKGLLDDATKTADDLVGEIEQRLTGMVMNRDTGIRSIGELLIPTLKLIEARVSARGKLSGVATGFSALDNATGGFQPEQLIIIGARPSVGKTAFALTMAIKQAADGNSVGFFSAEMSGELMTVRALGSVGSVNTMAMMNGYMKATDMSRLLESGERLRETPLWIDDTPNIPVGIMMSRARKMRRLGASIIYVDYLTLLKHGESRQPKWERVGEISKMLKGLARELHIPIVVLSQVNRNNSEGAPCLADMRQSGEIEEDADVVILMHKSDDTETGCTVHCNIAKNRTGPTAIFDLTFLKEYVRFENSEKEYTPKPYHERSVAQGVDR